MSEEKYSKCIARYKFYKEKSRLLTLELNKLQTIVNSCRVLLDGSVEQHSENVFSNAVLASSTPAKRALSFGSQSSSSLSCEEVYSDVEPEMKAKCERQSAPTSPEVDPDATFYDEQMAGVTENEENTSPQKSKSPSPVLAKEKRRKKQISPKVHICPRPRCPIHQPFYVSSKKEYNKLSPQSRKMARRTREKTPPGYWGLELPSTQYIRSRNQSSD